MPAGLVLRQAEARSGLIERAKMWKEAAEITIEQAGQKGNTIWVKSVLRRGVGEDVEDLVKDVRRYKNSNRNCDTTWATAGDREERRRRDNTMAFVLD
jgi:hypothetical protein